MSTTVKPVRLLAAAVACAVLVTPPSVLADTDAMPMATPESMQPFNVPSHHRLTFTEDIPCTKHPSQSSRRRC